jgi:HK97 family phage prohead protease
MTTPLIREPEPTRTLERRTVSTASLAIEQRAEGETEKPEIVGHAAVFDNWATLYEGRYLVWREIVRAGAFANAIKEKQDVRSLFNHDANFVLGRTRSGTLKLAEDKTGLLSRTDPPDTQLVRDLVLEPIRRGDVSQMSFAFIPRRNDKTVITEEDGVTIIDRGGERLTIRMEGDRQIEEREILDVNLYDVSPVTYPAYEATDVALRALGERREREIQARPSRRRLHLAEMRLRLFDAATTPNAR